MSWRRSKASRGVTRRKIESVSAVSQALSSTEQRPSVSSSRAWRAPAPGTWRMMSVSISFLSVLLMAAFSAPEIAGLQAALFGA